jgi:hypothetical protein
LAVRSATTDLGEADQATQMAKPIKATQSAEPIKATQSAQPIKRLGWWIRTTQLNFLRGGYDRD